MCVPCDSDACCLTNTTVNRSSCDVMKIRGLSVLVVYIEDSGD